jgi:hypothetical protein
MRDNKDPTFLPIFCPTFAFFIFIFFKKKKSKKMKKVSETIIYIFFPSFYWYFLKNENSINMKKNGHFSYKKKETIL